MKKRSLRDVYFRTIVKITALFILITFSTLVILTLSFLDLNSKYSVSQLQYIESQLNYYLNASENFIRTFSANSVVQKNMQIYGDNPNAFTIEAHDEIKEQVNTIIQSTDYIHAVNIYGLDGTLLVSNASNYQYPHIPDEILKTGTSLWSPKMVWNYREKETESVLTLVKPFYAISTSLQIGLIEISIPENAISSIFLSSQDTNSHLFMIDPENRIQSSADHSELFTTFQPTRKFPFSENSYIASSGIVFMKELPKINWKIVSITAPYLYFRPLYALLVITLVIMVFCILLSFRFSKKMAETVTTPLYQLIEYAKNLKTETWKPVQTGQFHIIDIEQLYKKFDKMMIEQEQLKNNLLQEQRQKNELQLNLLQEQIKPHFLYNTLDNICSLAEIGEQKKLIELVINLSSFYRHVLSGGRARISIADELEICRSYLHIMQIRYYNKFEYQIICPDELLNCSCIKLLLQPLIENSIYHGIKELEEKGFIKIEFTDQDETIRITVEDNGLGLRQDCQENKEKSSYFGIKNTNERIKLYYGPQYGLKLLPVEPHGCLAAILIKKEAMI